MKPDIYTIEYRVDLDKLAWILLKPADQYPPYFPCICDFIVINQSFKLDKLKIRLHTVKPVLNDHPKIDKTKIFMTNGS